MPYAAITPYTHPDRFTEEEAAYFDAGLCGYQTDYGLPWDKHCEEPSEPGADFGFCPAHAAQVAEEAAHRKASGI